MKFRYVILIFSALAAGAFAQSSAPASLGARQPRIVIPYIEPPACIGQTNVITTNTSIYTVTNTTYTETVIQIPVESGGVTNEYSVIGGITPVSEIVTHTNTVIVTNSVPLENPYKNLKYCDFVLKAVGQRLQDGEYNANGNFTPFLYVYASAYQIHQPMEDTDAKVFYLNSSRQGVDRFQRVEYVHSNGLQSASGNCAGAIEIYPSIKGKGGWMKQGNPNIKWICFLSNGIDFYRDPDSGNPMPFDVAVEWVDKIPKAGEWN